MYRYTAFISYANEDSKTAVRLQKKLESFKVPRPLVGMETSLGTVPSNLGQFFRDRTDAAGHPDLRAALRTALSNSRDLIVVCSPAAADPDCWVNIEIEDFRELRSDGRVFSIIVDGEPPNCFPQALLYGRGNLGESILRPEPLATDMRPSADGEREAILKLIAALIGVEFDQLRRRREEIQRRRRRLGFGLGLAYLISITGAAVLAIDASFGLAQSRSLAVADHARLANDEGQHDQAALLALAALPAPVGAVTSPIPEAKAQLLRAFAKNNLRQVIDAHDETILEMDLHPERPWVITGSVKGSVRITDWISGKVIHDLEGHADSIGGVAFSIDGDLVLTGAADGSLRIWDVETGSTRLKIDLGKISIRSVAFSSDADQVFAGTSDGFVYVFSTSSGKQIGRSENHGDFVTSIAVAPDGRVLSGAFNGRLIEWDPNLGNVIIDYGRVGTIDRLSYEKRSGRWAATKSLVKTVALWDPNDQTLNLSIDTGANGGTLNFSHDGQFLLTSHWDRTARLFDTTSGQLVAKLQHPDWVDGAAFSKDGRTIVTADHQGKIRVWDNPAILADYRYHTEVDSKPGAAEIGPDGEDIYIGSWSGRIVVRSVDGKNERTLEQKLINGIQTIAIAPDAKRLAVIRQDNQIEILTEDSGQHIALDYPRNATDRGIAFLGNDILIIASKEGQLQAWSIDSGQTVDTAALPASTYALAVAAAPHGRQVAVAGSDGRLWLWTIGSDPKPHATWRHGRAAQSVAWSGDGEQIATGGADGRIFIGNADFKGSPLAISAGQTSGTWVHALRFSGDGTILASAGGDGSLQLWDTQSGIEIWETNIGSKKPGTASLPSLFVLLTPDNKFIFGMNSGGQVSRFRLNLPTGNWLASACNMLPVGRRMFTKGELVDFDFVGEDSVSPCDRVGLFSFQYWQRRVRSWLGHTLTAFRSLTFPSQPFESE